VARWGGGPDRHAVPRADPLGAQARGVGAREPLERRVADLAAVGADGGPPGAGGEIPEERVHGASLVSRGGVARGGWRPGSARAAPGRLTVRM
jgi:hypothetical protein